MRMRVIPVQSGRLIRRNIHGVVQRFTRHGNHRQNIIPRSIWRYMQTMKMKVRHVHARPLHADLGRTLGHLVEIIQLNRSARHRPYYGRIFMPFKNKRSLTCCRIVDSLKLERSHNLRRVGQWCADGWMNGLTIYICGPNNRDCRHQLHLMYRS